MDYPMANLKGQAGGEPLLSTLMNLTLTTFMAGLDINVCRHCRAYIIIMWQHRRGDIHLAT
jgi:hypothetical protein